MSQITVSHLTFAYDGACDNVFEDVSFVLDTDWRLGLTGRNGNHAAAALRKYIPSIKHERRRIFATPFQYSL